MARVAIGLGIPLCRLRSSDLAFVGLGAHVSARSGPLLDASGVVLVIIAMLMLTAPIIQHRGSYRSLCRSLRANVTAQSKKRKFVADGVFRAELNELLTRELSADG